MEGHVLVALLDKKTGDEFTLKPINFPALALLVSGGHTELVLIHDYARYEKIGQTVDDAVGEAFDKVARILGMPYPGGRAVSEHAAKFRASGAHNDIEMPRPMLHSGDYNFSYSGLKTAMLYKVRELTENGKREISEEQKLALCAAFEDAAIEVIIKKTAKAVDEFNIQTLIVGGGVAANTYLRQELANALSDRTTILFPETWLSTDNSVMIAIAAYVRALHGHTEHEQLSHMKADGNLSITDGGFRK
jgi:N6-L-threonylcarbamoyladenine synthase